MIRTQIFIPFFALLYLFTFSSCFVIKTSDSKNRKMEYSVYNACLDSLLLNPKIGTEQMLVLMDSTRNFTGGASREARRILSDSIAYELHLNYTKLNKTGNELIDKKQLHSTKQILYYSEVFRILNTKNEKNYNENFWSEIHIKYPRIKYIVQLSKISFSKNGYFALLQIKQELDSIDSISSQIYLKKEKNEWKIVFIK